MDDKFYMILREDGARSQKRHTDLDSTKDEAARLARRDCAKYFIMESVYVVEALEAPVEYREI